MTRKRGAQAPIHEQDLSVLADHHVVGLDVAVKDAYGAIKEGQEVVGNRTRVRVVKNKMAPPFMDAEFDILYGEGISQMGDLLDVGVDAGVIDKSGSWYSFQGERIGQGRQNVVRFLKENVDIHSAALIRTSEALGLSKREEQDTETDE